MTIEPKNKTERRNQTVRPRREYKGTRVSQKANFDSTLFQSEALFGLLTNAMLDIIAVTDEYLCIKYVSPSYKKVLGHEPEGLLGKPLPFELIHPDDRAAVEDAARTAIANNRVCRSTYRFLHADGNYLWLETIGTIAPASNGMPTRFVFCTRDVTEQRKAEIGLKESEVKYRLLFELGSDAIFLIDNQTGDIIDANQRASVMYGYSHEELLQMKHTQLSGEQIDTRRATMLKKNIVPVRYHKKKNGTIFPVEITASHFLRNGHALHIASIRDITFRLEMQEAIKVSEEKYRALFESSGDAIFISSLRDRVIDCNRKATEMFAISRQEFTGKGVLDVSPPLQPDQIPSRKKAIELTRELLSGADIHFNWQCMKSNGTLFDTESTLSKFSVHGEPYIITIVRDVTERKLAENKLAETIDLLRNSMGALIQALIRVVETRDPYTAGHQKRVANIARAIATELSLDSDIIEGIRVASSVHDIGKISIPTEILSKPGAFTTVEFELVKVHSQSGYEILKEIEFDWPVAEIVLQHHERINGSGYPRGLKKDEILLEAKILAVADVVEAMTSHRPYRPALGMEASIKAITEGKGILFEEKVVDACIDMLNSNNNFLVQCFPDN